MTDGATTPQERAAAFRELCDIVLSVQPQQAGASATSTAPEAGACGNASLDAVTPTWVVFSVEICRDEESVDAAWALM